MFRLIGLMVFAGLMMVSAPRAQADDGKTLASIDLTGPFKTRSPWRFTATQGLSVADPATGDTAPGAIRLCLSHDGVRNCDPAAGLAMRVNGQEDLFSEPHFLDRVSIEHPAADRPLLFVRIGSFLSGDGGQRVATLVYRYDAAGDRFVVAYQYQTGHNNNEEVRYVADGPMRGTIISAEPTEDAPYGFWVTVNRLDANGNYKSVLHYRSATHYGDGNPLAVIDSEMPNLEARMGLWRPGRPLPLPPESCLRPHLVHKELWCQ